MGTGRDLQHNCARVGLPRAKTRVVVEVLQKIVLCACMGNLGTRTDVQQVFARTLWYTFKHGGTGGGGASITGTVKVPL